jgi:hypothetical protein
VNQLGSSDYTRPHKFRGKACMLAGYRLGALAGVPGQISEDGTGLWIDRATAVLTQDVANARRC